MDAINYFPFCYNRHNDSDNWWDRFYRFTYHHAAGAGQYAIQSASKAKEGDGKTAVRPSDGCCSEQFDR